MEIMRGIVKYSDKIMDSVDYENDSDGKMVRTGIKAGIVEGIGDAFLVFGAISFASSIIDIVKMVKEIKK